MGKVILREQLDWFLEKAYHCWLKNEHHVKTGSSPNCYRCGKRVLGLNATANYTYVNGPVR